MSDSHGEHARALEEVDLLHLLTCATCWEKTVGLLVMEAQANFDGGEPSDDDTQEDLSAADWRACQSRGGKPSNKAASGARSRTCCSRS